MTLGMPEMIFIFVLALLLFGPKNLPELARQLGKAMAGCQLSDPLIYIP